MRLASGDGQSAVRRVATMAGIFVVAVVLWGGYSRRWPWTGINGSTATLWDWLNLLLLPLVIALAPIWARADRTVDERAKKAALAGLPVFALIVLLGYLVPWGWTGFRGNTLWDWLGLTVLPVVVILIPSFAELQARWNVRHTRWAAIGLAVFGLIVLAGYVVPWAWTGFTGNTLWDWLHLLLVPLLIPTVLVPVLSAMVVVEVRKNEKERAESPAIAVEPAQPESSSSHKATSAQPISSSGLPGVESQLSARRSGVAGHRRGQAEGREP